MGRGRVCAVEGCRNKERLFLMPKRSENKDKFFAWLRATGNKKLLQVDPRSLENKFICWLHFEVRYLYRRKLAKAAIPTLRLPAPLDITELVECDMDNKPNLQELNASLGRTICSNMANDHIVWIDMELTGLDIETCHIIELSCIITNSDLKIISNVLNIVIHQPDYILENMNDWCKAVHRKTNIINEARNSNISLSEAEQILLRYLQSHIPKGKCPLGGNSVYMDRLFLSKYMPLVNDYLHYRIIDVSTIKELARRWNPQIYNNAPIKSHNHRSTTDIRESIKELVYYKNYMFMTGNS